MGSLTGPPSPAGSENCPLPISHSKCWSPKPFRSKSPVPSVTYKCLFWKLKDILKIIGSKWVKNDGQRYSMMIQVGDSERWTSSTNDIKELLRSCSTINKIIFWLRGKCQMTVFLYPLQFLIYKIKAGRVARHAYLISKQLPWCFMSSLLSFINCQEN